MDHAVVIGGSLGGLEALCLLTQALPADFPAPIMVVLHTAPDGPMLGGQILGRTTPLRACYGGEGMAAEPGHIYLAPPDRHLVVRERGALHLDDGPKVRHSRPSVDVLFQAAARVYGTGLIGIVLTGGDHDGTAGLRAVKAAGGTAVVQTPEDARNPEMPRSAIAGGHPDYVVPLGDIAPLLLRLVR
jgi:two-component system chemotaxis response regulator CheB